MHQRENANKTKHTDEEISIVKIHKEALLEEIDKDCEIHGKS